MIYYCRTQMNEDAGNCGGQTETAKRLLLAALRLEYGMEVLPEIAVSEMGKPYFPSFRQIHFNYSHCRKGVLCGISECEIGVDMETVREYRTSLAARICHENEASALRLGTGAPAWMESSSARLTLTKLWVAKEAYLKCLGTGIRSDLRLLDMSGILDGYMERPDGMKLKLWVTEDICMCACAKEKKEFVLRRLQI